MLARTQGKTSPWTLLVGMQISVATMEIDMEAPQEN
jgi:hypothetical protein